MRRYEYTIKSADYLSCLLSEYQWLKLLKTQNKAYDLLLDYLIELGEYEFSEKNYSKNKRQINNIATELNCKYFHIAKWLPEIYNDIFTLNEEKPELFHQENFYKYTLSFSTRYDYFYGFQLWLPVVLNRYDTFIFNFIKGKVNETYFWVEDISYTHEYGKSCYQVDLKGGYFNSYRELLLEKVKFMNAISLHDLIESSEYDLDDKLREYERSGHIRESEESLQKRRKNRIW